MLGTTVAVAACTNVTGDLAKGATRIAADPNPIEIDTNSDHSIIVQAFDDQGSALSSSGSVGPVTGPATVVFDTSYQHGAVRYSTRFIVRGTGLGVATYTVTDNGLSTIDTAIVEPPVSNFVATVVDTSTPLMFRDTLTVTIPAGEPYRFTAASKAFIGLPTVALSKMDSAVSVSPDGLTAKFVPSGARTGVVYVSAVLNYRPTLTKVFYAANTDTVRVTPVAPDTVTVTAIGLVIADPDHNPPIKGQPPRDSVYWSPVKAVAPFQVYRALAQTGPYTKIADVNISAGNTLFYLDTLITTGTTYFYTMRSCNGPLCSIFAADTVSATAIP
jgi:hypothetical protein